MRDQFFTFFKIRLFNAILPFIRGDPASALKALSHLDDLASVCPTYENLANTLTYVE